MSGDQQSITFTSQDNVHLFLSAELNGKNYDGSLCINGDGKCAFLSKEARELDEGNTWKIATVHVFKDDSDFMSIHLGNKYLSVGVQASADGTTNVFFLEESKDSVDFQIEGLDTTLMTLEPFKIIYNTVSTTNFLAYIKENNSLKETYVTISDQGQGLYFVTEDKTEDKTKDKTEDDKVNEDDYKGLTKNQKIGIGAGIGVSGVIILLVIIGIVYHIEHKKKSRQFQRIEQ